MRTGIGRGGPGQLAAARRVRAGAAAGGYLETENGSERFHLPVSGLGFGAEGDGAVGEGEAFAGPEGVVARVGGEDAEAEALGTTAAGLRFEVAQQGLASAGAAGRGGNDHQAKVSVCRGGEAEGHLSDTDQVGVEQADAEAGLGGDAGRDVGEEFGGDLGVGAASRSRRMYSTVGWKKASTKARSAMASSLRIGMGNTLQGEGDRAGGFAPGDLVANLRPQQGAGEGGMRRDAVEGASASSSPVIS